MDNREWMYMGCSSQSDYTMDWVNKTDAFLNHAFGEAARGEMLVLCPYSKCANRKRQNRDNMAKHLVKNGFMPNYTQWIHHGEAHHMREEAVRPRVEDFDADAGLANMLDDFHEA
jgi:hypothetical protein